MVTKVLIVVLVAFFATSDALECQTCRGTTCSKDEIPIVECSRRIARLPYDFESSALNLEDSHYACVSLEYEEDQKSIPVRQCYVISEEEDLCDNIASALPFIAKLNKCYVKSDLFDAVVSDDDLLERADESTTQGPTSPAPQATTQGAGATALSFVALAMSVILHRNL